MHGDKFFGNLVPRTFSCQSELFTYKLQNITFFLLIDYNFKLMNDNFLLKIYHFFIQKLPIDENEIIFLLLIICSKGIQVN